MQANPCVAILRHQLFLPSETFISAQARALREFAPVLAGRVLCGPPAEDLAWFVPAAGALRQLDYVLRRDPGLFLPGLATFGPRLVHAHFGVEAVYGMALARRLDIPLVTTFHGFDATLKRRELISSRKPTWIQYLLRRGELRQSGTIFIAVSEFIRRRLVALGFPEQRIRLHYIGVDTETFAPAAGGTDEEDAVLNGAGSTGVDVSETDRPPLILHVARLVEKKGTAFLLEAFARISNRHPDASVVIIGAGPLRAELAGRAEALGIGNRVLWLGARPHEEVRTWLRRATVFCLPSCTAGNGDAEGLGLVLVEAAATGVPVVGTRHGGIPEAVIDGETGLLVPERDAASLADALETLLASATIRRKLGDAARRLARERFDLATQTRELERLYGELV